MKATAKLYHEIHDTVVSTDCCRVYADIYRNGGGT
jgi:hypothetical protein